VPLAESVVVIAGGGMLGVTASAMAAEAGARVVLIEPQPERRGSALEFGADAVVDPGEGAAAVRKLIASTGRAGGHASLATVAFELSGSPVAARLLLGSVDSGGVLVLAGSTFPVPELALSPERFIHDSLTIRGVHEYAPEQLGRAVAFLRQTWTRYPFASQVGAVFPLASIDEALAAAVESAHSGGPRRIAVAAK
jgi:threonine dehydrogenase-like Zn-dependent dehydrogenase